LGKHEEKLDFVECDLGDIWAVKRAAEQIRQSTDRLDILMCNAGMEASWTISSPNDLNRY
jgi:NAD(P)-dependent dehydrogenase (short-subunit alcohol dehydrogenase family)